MYKRQFLFSFLRACWCIIHRNLPTININSPAKLSNDTYEFDYDYETCTPDGQRSYQIAGDSSQSVWITDKDKGVSVRLYNKDYFTKLPGNLISSINVLQEDRSCRYFNNVDRNEFTENTPIGPNGPIISTGGSSTGFGIVDQVKSMIPCQSSNQYGNARIDLAYSATSTSSLTSISGQLQPGGIGGTPGNHYVGRNYSGDLLFAVQMTQGNGSTVSYAIILSLCPSPLFQATSQFQQFSANGITIAANAGYQVGNLGSQTTIVVTTPNSNARSIPLIFAPL